MITDLQYLEFLMKLAGDQRGSNGLCLSEWESNFVSSFCRSSRRTLWFTEGRRQAVDRMWRKYGAELSYPHPLDCVPQRPTVAAADPDGCQYLIRDSQESGGTLQRRCNEPAAFREPGRLRYCTTHAEAVKRACPKIQLIPFNHHETAQAESVAANCPDQAQRIDSPASIKAGGSSGSEGKSGIAARGDFKFPRYT